MTRLKVANLSNYFNELDGATDFQYGICLANKEGVAAWIPIFLIFTSVSETPIAAKISKTQIRDQILPVVLNKFEPTIQRKLEEKLVEINQGFVRDQRVEYSLYDAIEKQIPDLKKLSTAFSANPKDWEEFLERLRFVRIQGNFKLKIRPEAESLEIKFGAPAQSRNLVDFRGKVISKPEIELLSVIDLRLIEIDPDTGSQKSFEISTQLKEILSASTRFVFPQTEFSVSGSIADTAGPDPLVLELQSWESGFRNLVLTDEQIAPVMNALFRNETFFESLKVLMKLDTTKKAESTFEKDLKAYLDNRSVDLVIWVEKKADGTLKPHLSSKDDPNTLSEIEEARAEKRLILEAVGKTSLRSDDLKIDYNPNSRIAKLEFDPLSEISERFEVKSLYLQEEWRGDVKDPTVRSVLDLIYGKNLFENQSLFITPVLEIPEGTAELEIPLGWRQDGPEFLSAFNRVQLSILDKARFKTFQVDWGTNDRISLDMSSVNNLDKQIAQQISPFIRAHESVLGEKFFQNSKNILIREAQRQIESMTIKKSATSAQPVSFDMQITSFPFSQEGDLVCRFSEPVHKVREKDAIQTAFELSDKIPKDMALLMAPPILEMDCEIKLPKKIGIYLKNVTSSDGTVGQVRFDFQTRDGTNPVVPVKWRLVRDPQGGFLVFLPSKVDWSKALTAYDIPLSGAGAPQISEISPSFKTVKGATASGVHIGAAIWNNIFAPKIPRDQSEELYLFHLGSVVVSSAADAYVRKIERKEIERVLRESVDQAKSNLQRTINDEIFKTLNGDISQRREFELQNKRWTEPLGTKRAISGQPLIDPQTLDRGLLGQAELRIQSEIHKFLETIPLHESLGRIKISPTQNLEQLAVQEVGETVRQTIEGDPKGIEKISNTVSNPIIKDQTSKLQNKVASYLKESISQSYKQIEDAVINFLRYRSSPQEEAPMEVVQSYLTDQIKTAVSSRFNFSAQNLQLPGICGISMSVANDPVMGDFYTIMGNVESLNGQQPFQLPHEDEAPRLMDFLKEADAQGGFEIGFSTRFLEQIANDPKNLEIVENQIIQEAQQTFGVSKNLSVQIRDVRVRMTAEGQSVVRLKVKVNQQSTAVEGVLGFIGFIPDAVAGLLTGDHIKPFKQVGWMIDRATSPVTDVDGFLEVEVPISVAMGDRVSSGSDKIIGHYLSVRTETNSTKILATKGWESVFGRLAKNQVEDEMETIQRSIYIDRRLSVPGFEDSFGFKLSRQLNDEADKPLFIGLPTIREGVPDGDGLYKGSFHARILLDIEKEAMTYPVIKATRK